MKGLSDNPHALKEAASGLCNSVSAGISGIEEKLTFINSELKKSDPNSSDISDAVNAIQMQTNAMKQALGAVGYDPRGTGANEGATVRASDGSGGASGANNQ